MTRLLLTLEKIGADADIPAISQDMSAVTDGSPPQIVVLDAVSKRDNWKNGCPQFGKYRFPRSDLIRSFEKAMDDKASSQPAQHAAAEWNKEAALVSWFHNPKIPRWWPKIGLPIAVTILAIVGGIAEQAETRKLFVACAILIGLLLLVAGLMTRGIWLWAATHLPLPNRYRWLATSSFFAVLGGRGFDGRLRSVFDRMAAPERAKYHLQMKTFAFLEDMRDNHRIISPTLRGLKRTCPPVVFLRGITRDNGGIELLSAMSDIRSRRSELHPLLVVASIDHAHREELDGFTSRSTPVDLGPGRTQDDHRSLRERYHDWMGELGTAQAPSEHVPLPWLLRLPVREEISHRDGHTALRVRRRPRWTWVWSLGSLAVMLAATTSGGWLWHSHLMKTYCSVHFPFSWSPDLLRDGDGHDQQCIGVATEGVRFERGHQSISLDSTLRDFDPKMTNPVDKRRASITLADLQSLVNTENARVIVSGSPYVTVLYVGMLTAAAGDEASAVSSIKELAGAYLAQLSNNETGQPKIRLLAANAGQSMTFASDMTDRIIDLTRRDPTIVGVIGVGRNTKSSQDAIQRLSGAGLPVISTVNSSDVLPSLSHYYGLINTDFDEARALTTVAADKKSIERNARALIISRDPDRSNDLYSDELAGDAAKLLPNLRPRRLRYVGKDDIASKVKDYCDDARSDPYSLVVFTGRAEDMRGLMWGLAKGGCTERRITLLAGDDVIRARFGTGLDEVQLPENITVYYATGAHLQNLDTSNSFFIDAANRFGITIEHDVPLLEDSQMALAYDAMSAIGQASRSAFEGLDLTGRDVSTIGNLLPGSRSVASGAVLLELRHLQINDAATGTIDFTGDHKNEDNNTLPNRGLTIVKVATQNRRPVSSLVCGEKNGGARVPGLSSCLTD